MTYGEDRPPQHRRTRADGPTEDYIEVHERLQLFYAAYPKGAVVTDHVQFLAGDKAMDQSPRVVVAALAYRTPDDRHPGVGYSWMVVPGKTPFTNGSELENTETSAWGRAIAAVGIAINRSVASADEIRAKREPAAEPDLRDRVIAEATGSPHEGQGSPVQAAPVPEPAPAPKKAPKPAEGLTMEQFEANVRAKFVQRPIIAKAAAVLFPDEHDVASLTDRQRLALWDEVDPGD